MSRAGADAHVDMDPDERSDRQGGGRRRLARWLPILAVVALSVALALPRTPPRLDAHDVAGTAPAQEAVLAEGGWPAVAGYVATQADAGRPTIVVLFASWCEPCREELPEVAVVAARETDVAFIGVAHEDREAAARALLDEVGPLGMPSVQDPEGETARTLLLLGMPSVAFFDRDGRLAGGHVGPVTPAVLEAWIAGLTGRGPLPA